MAHDQDRSAASRSAALRSALGDWFARDRRDLPWRETRDPYRVLVSETMLQQTQAARVVPAYTAFLGRFPSLGELAAASTAAVVQQWRGLGYNRRAVNLQRTARAVVERYAGVLPHTVAELEQLPGIGPYTARAVLVFAHEQPVAAVDVNVARVLSRAVAGRAMPPRERQRLGDDLVAPDPWTTAQALIELGARHCTARAPRCRACPVAGLCAWQRSGAAAPDPATHNRRSQAPFGGSDRYHRGRLLDALRTGPVAAAQVAAVSDTDDLARAGRLADDLVADGLATWSLGRLTLPEQNPDERDPDEHERPGHEVPEHDSEDRGEQVRPGGAALARRTDRGR